MHWTNSGPSSWLALCSMHRCALWLRLAFQRRTRPGPARRVVVAVVCRGPSPCRKSQECVNQSCTRGSAMKDATNVLHVPSAPLSLSLFLFPPEVCSQTRQTLIRIDENSCQSVSSCLSAPKVPSLLNHGGGTILPSSGPRRGSG